MLLICAPMRQLVLSAFGVAVGLMACGHDADEGASRPTDGAPTEETPRSDMQVECDGAGWKCVGYNGQGRGATGPQGCDLLNYTGDGKVLWQFAGHCGEDSMCCQPTPGPTACFDVPEAWPSPGPDCEPANVTKPVAFETRGDFDSYLYGRWMLCPESTVPTGAASTTVGLSFNGSEEYLHVNAIVRAGSCTSMDEHIEASVRAERTDGSATTWTARFAFDGQPRVTIAGLAASPKRILLDNGAVLLHRRFR